MEPSSITLVIKTPNQRVRDIEVNCLLDWTVEKLKSHLTKVYPTKPARSSQKIIYSGKLLHDHFVLKDILHEHEGQQQAVHLVCTPSASDIVQGTSELNSASPEPSRPQATVPEVTTSSTTTFSATQPDGLRHRTPHHTYPHHPYYNVYHSHLHTLHAQGQHGHTSGTPFTPGHPHLHPNAHHVAAQHMAHMQWMHHHMTQIMQGMPYASPMQPPFPYPQQPAHDQTQPTTPPPVAAPPAQAAQAQERQENQQRNNVVMNANAGGGMMQDEDEEENLNRDWLDHVYMGVRILMLLSIFWFYSSAERLLLMAVAMFVVWLLQSGWFNLNRAPRNRRQDVQENAANEDEEEHEDDDGDKSETDSQSGDETDANTTSSSDVAEPEHPGYLVVCYNFVTTFFTSLLPQGPRPID